MLNECRWIEACSETDTRPNLLTHKADLLDRKLVWLQCTSKMSKMLIVLPVKQILRLVIWLVKVVIEALQLLPKAIKTNASILVMEVQISVGVDFLSRPKEASGLMWKIYFQMWALVTLTHLCSS